MYWVGETEKIQFGEKTGMTGILISFATYEAARDYVISRAVREVEASEKDLLDAQQHLRRCERLPKTANE